MSEDFDRRVDLARFQLWHAYWCVGGDSFWLVYGPPQGNQIHAANARHPKPFPDLIQSEEP